MTMVVRNNNLALVPKAAALAPLAYKAGKAIVPYVIDTVADYVNTRRKNNKKKKGRNYNEGPQVLVGGRSMVAAPVAVTKRMPASRPKFRQSSGSVVVSHRELITTIANTTGALSVNSGMNVTGNYRVNPSNARLFTWLPTIAANFDTYKFINVRFIYVPLCATTETGRVALLWDKDSNDPLPVDRAAISAYSHSNESAPWSEVMLNIPMDNVSRFVNESGTSDRKLLDLGQFLFAVYGGGSSNAIGDIYVEYTVAFKDAQPAGTLVEDTIIDIGGTLTINGPEYVTNSDVAMTSSSLTYNVNTPGTFFFTLALNTTSVSNITISGNGTSIGVIRGGTQVGTGLFSGVLSSSGLPNATATITVNGLAGLTRAQANFVRCNTTVQFTA